jgi:hypothetical protein
VLPFRAMTAQANVTRVQNAVGSYTVLGVRIDPCRCEEAAQLGGVM